MQEEEYGRIAGDSNEGFLPSSFRDSVDKIGFYTWSKPLGGVSISVISLSLSWFYTNPFV